MKAIINSIELGTELKFIQSVIRKNVIIPITAAVKMDFGKNTLTVTGTDLETTATFTMDCDCKKPFVMCIDFEDILKVCSRLSEPITIELKDTSILISGDNSNFKFSKVGEAEHFPVTPEEELDLKAEVDADFFYALTAASSCKHKDELKENMNKPCVDFKKKEITVVGTDANYLYLKNLKAKPTKEARVMIPETFVQLTKNFQDTTISANEKTIKAEYGNKTIISRLSEAKYVTYEMILPKDAVYNFKANKHDLKKSLQVVGVTASITTNMCVLNFKENELLITSQDIDFGKESDTKLAVNHSVEFENICINGGFMLHVLNLLDSEEIEMAFTTPEKTIYIKPVGDDTVLSLLQPLMITNN